ncbi:MAG: hypothetical protein A2161_04940 [Candidatus Schekmanbacteria bacterium RBG_13_48_7]|uniref:Uncharacterized protein n=1 Tax=Candidatus Schekmanbacteria bacterium RBG_13_48_7 TaxID=1817878 RepID=A0A1F7RLX5_9BACT|nr:MAG: hypothetical protein A2161_04940 [Candidatus Schekmanbacteria bacterium RBG_13_48_7]
MKKFKFNIKIIIIAFNVVTFGYFVLTFYGCDQITNQPAANCSQKSGTRFITPAEMALEMNMFRETGVSTVYSSPMRILDYGHVTVIEDNGTFEGTPAGIIPVVKRFYSKHPDVYDFITIYSNFEAPGMDSVAWHTDVTQTVEGIGKPLSDFSSDYGSKGRLKGIQYMNSLSKYSGDPDSFAYLAFDAYHLLGRVLSLQWAANFRFRDRHGYISTDLLDLTHPGHWLNCVELNKDLLNGHSWRDNGDGTYTDIGSCQQYGLLTLYAMGLIDKSEVAPFLVLARTDSGSCTACCFNLRTIPATARTVTINDIISAEGFRNPDYSVSQKHFNMAFILVVKRGEFPPLPLEIQFVEKVRSTFPAVFEFISGARGSMNTNLIGPVLPK